MFQCRRISVFVFHRLSFLFFGPPRGGELPQCLFHITARTGCQALNFHFLAFFGRVTPVLFIRYFNCIDGRPYASQSYSYLLVLPGGIVGKIKG